VTRTLQPAHYQFLLLALCAVIYAPGLSGPMLLEDYPRLTPLMAAEPRDWHTLADTYLLSNGGLPGRPVSMASFIANAMLHGDELRHWKATNLLIHSLTAIVVLLAWIIRQPRVLAAAGIVVLLTWSSLTVVRAGIWGSASLQATHFEMLHPRSKLRPGTP
jgi:hypothetical protein